MIIKEIYLPSSGKKLSIERCQTCRSKMVNVDKDELKEVDANMLIFAKIRWSNPKTEKLVCVGCEISSYLNINKSHTFRTSEKPKTKIEDEDDDNDFFNPASPSSLFRSGGLFGGGFSGGGFGGGGATR